MRYNSYSIFSYNRYLKIIMQVILILPIYSIKHNKVYKIYY